MRETCRGRGQVRIVYNAMVLKEPYSGVEIIVHQMADAFSRYGTLPICACLPRKHRPVSETVRLKLYPAADWASRSRLMRILWEQTVLPVFLARTHATLLHAPAYVSPVLSPVPVVLTIHDLYVMTHPQFCRHRNRAHYNLFIPRSIHRASAIITFSEYMRRTIETRFPEAEDRIVVVPPGLTPGLARCEDFNRLQTLRQKYKLPSFFLLFVGDMSRRKNLQGLISAFAIVQAERPDLHLILAGAATPETAAEVDSIVRSYGIGHRVRRIGYVESENLATLYSLAQAFVFPSHDEGFGLPPLEAMACGCPVVCSGGAPVENCGEAAVSCDPRDVTSIAGGVSMLLDNPSIRKEKVRLGYEAAARFTWEGAVRRTESVSRAVGEGRMGL